MIPVVGGSVEDEDVVEVLSLVVLSSKNYEIAVQGIHGVSMTRFRLNSFRFELHPLEFAHSLKVNFPDIVEIQAR
jgi:hypothetical protein